ncbi:phosphopantothenoylcysteine decarboxylase [Hymenobacter lapidiphilus]|uniref:phosphopantothenoylcysteine decarboxylase domain-containing protein n=1 Tax=Hymenobacter sp. CCM 8763 TaxID=2303334 RepID=UPI000E34DD95|nr:phosphopantothenoylcysteine decarboxylase [Hymenobacter sp. CCM 8763]RFP65309.1 phosphopantothenoylcysteine decarboxylase [Hymenobacter sp. CCM 8763]
MRVLITAGPTHEPLDPVRFLGNHSTGKMGYALAEAFAAAGAEVALISGPTNLPDPASPHILTTRVQTAAEMYEAAADAARLADVWIFAAAVADYRPAEVATQKIKKSGERLTLELVKNVDIAFELGKTKRPEQFSVGFALETENEQAHALGKLERKNFDLIVLNSLRDAGAGFRHDTNQVTLLEADGRVTAFGLKSKTSVALDIMGVVLDRLAARHV